MRKSLVLARFLATPKVAHWLQRYPPKPLTEATFDKANRRWTVKVWSGRAGEIAPGNGRGRRRPGLAGTDRAAGRVEHGARAGRLLRRQGAERVVGVDPAQRRVLPRARRRAPHPLVAHLRPAGAALVRVLAAVLQPRAHLHERVARGAPARLPARAHLLDRVSWPCLQPGALLAVWVLAALRSFSAGFGSGSTSRRRAASSTSASPA